MVKVTRFDGSELYVNADLVEFIEATPDTVMTLTTHRKIVVREPAEQVVSQIIAYQRQVRARPAASLVTLAAES